MRRGRTSTPTRPLPEIVYNLDRLPEPVRRMHDLIVEACKSGDIEKLRPLLDTGEDGTQLSLGGIDGDPIAFLRELSGDKEGQEILAILEEVLSAGYRPSGCRHAERACMSGPISSPCRSTG